mgnify:CR=1 FL=1
MRYYNIEMAKRMRKTKEDEALQKHFQDSEKWGACVYFDENNNVDFIEINKLSDVTQRGETWTHYATIGVYKSEDANNGKFWELYSQFNGKDEDELWVFAYYKNFGDAVRRVKLGIEKLKPIKIY